MGLRINATPDWRDRALRTGPQYDTAPELQRNTVPQVRREAQYRGGGHPLVEPAPSLETDEKMAADLAGPRYHINRSNLLVLESKADMQKRGQASPDDGDALALTFAQPLQPAEVEEEDDEEEFGRYTGSSSSGGWMR